MKSEFERASVQAQEELRPKAERSNAGINEVGNLQINRIERLDYAITVTAYVMQRHNLPQLMPTLKRLEAEREKLRVDGAYRNGRRGQSE